jgi:hypothetical protein
MYSKRTHQHAYDQIESEINKGGLRLLEEAAADERDTAGEDSETETDTCGDGGQEITFVIEEGTSS